MDTRYRAFISYSHQDQELARRLHAWLEAFQIPAGLVGASAPLRPVFLDEAELGAAACLDGKLKAMLDASDALVVVASPAAARSAWVDQEVAHFKAMKPQAPCLALIAAGEPFAKDGEMECFSPALRHVVRDGAVTAERQVPLAPDVGKHGEEGAFLRLVAGLIGVDFGLLMDRHAAREAAETRRRRRALARAYTLPARQAQREFQMARALKYVLAYVLEAGDPGLSEAPELKHVAQVSCVTLADRAVLRGHEKPVSWVQFNPDATKLVTGSSDGTIRVWSLADGQQLLCKGKDSIVSSVAFSPDGSQILTTSYDGTAKLMDAETGHLVRALFHEDKVTAGAFSRDGTAFATAGWDGTARLMRVGSEVQVLSLHTGRLNDVTFSPNGELLATASEDGTVRLWDAKSGEAIHVLAGHEADVRRARFSPDGQRLASVSKDRSARVWDVASGRQTALAEGHDGWIWFVAWSADGARIVTASEDKSARIWDAASGQVLAQLDHGDVVQRAIFSPDGARVATASWDGSAVIWDAMTGARLASLVGHEGRVFDVAFSNDGRLVATASEDATARVWSVTHGAEVLRFDGPDEQIELATLDAQSSCLVATSKGRRSWLWDAATGAELPALGSAERPVARALFSPAGDKLLTCTLDGEVQIWDVRGAASPVRIAADGDWERVAFSRDGSKLLAIGDRGQAAQIWDTTSGAKFAERRQGDSFSKRAISRDGALLAHAFGTVLTVTDTASEVRMGEAKIFNESIEDLDFDPDGQRLVVASWDNLARIYEVASDKAPLICDGHTGGVTVAQFSPDGTMVLTGSADRSARLWESETGLEICRLDHESSLTSARFDAAGDRVVTVTSANVVRLFDVRFCRLAGESVTAWICNGMRRGLGPLTAGDKKDLLLRGTAEEFATDDFVGEVLRRWPHLAEITDFPEPQHVGAGARHRPVRPSPVETVPAG